MRAVDTNVLVRLVTRDDPRQAAAADAFVARGAWVSHAGHLPLGTFDRELGRLDGGHRL